MTLPPIILLIEYCSPAFHLPDIPAHSSSDFSHHAYHFLQSTHHLSTLYYHKFHYLPIIDICGIPMNKKEASTIIAVNASSNYSSLMKKISIYFLLLFVILIHLSVPDDKKILLYLLHY